MHRLLRRLAVLGPALVLVAAGCGQSQQSKLFHQIESDCATAAANGWTINQASISFRGADVGFDTRSSPATTDIGTLPGFDTCGTASPTNPVVQFYWEWQATDTSLCNSSPIGQLCCLLCEVRVTGTELQAHQGDAVLCASRAGLGQACQ